MTALHKNPVTRWQVLLLLRALTTRCTSLLPQTPSQLMDLTLPSLWGQASPHTSTHASSRSLLSAHLKSPVLWDLWCIEHSWTGASLSPIVWKMEERWEKSTVAIVGIKQIYGKSVISFKHIINFKSFTLMKTIKGFLTH